MFTQVWAMRPLLYAANWSMATRCCDTFMNALTGTQYVLPSTHLNERAVASSHEPWTDRMIGALLVERSLRLPHFSFVPRQVNQRAESIVNSADARVGVVDHATRGDAELADTLLHRSRVPYAPHADFELRARAGAE